MIYLPGRFTQNPSATWDLLLGYHEQYLFQLRCYDIHVSHPRLHGWGNGWGRTRWMDLSQFDFNPQFLSLFANSILTASGVVEITLPPRILSADISGWHSLPNTAMEYLDSHLTHPPVVSLNISTWVPQLSESKPRPRKALHIFNIRNEKGIRILQLVSAMKNAYGLAIEHWLHWTKVLRTIVDEMHWDQDIWIIGNAPKLLISLDPYVSGGENLLSVYYLSCMYALRDRDERQAEWMPKPMFRHAASLPRISPLGGWAYP
ncbi:hypothetical protein P154DRAFT_519880 [Amniculicola lignicola CBS 123094]|uniref:Uncharacterized protein n=1 Tax=Amniculicola lignicola CBS 123094 TaxID=1392246 RepID=A0A6A5X105_9PLEO|nr:hypothetical protein P154DRAFT_519880 [Amniculicola lignicola CBS 123094]